MRRLLLVLLVSATSAQSPSAFTKAAPSIPPPSLVVWSAPGAIGLPFGSGWNFQSLVAYDKANRPVALFKNESLQVNASFILFMNLSGEPTAEGCQADVIGPLTKQFQSSISQRKEGRATGSGGKTYPSTSYLLTAEVTQRNTFAFAGNAATCAEIHVSTVLAGPAADSALQTALMQFSPDLEHTPTPSELFAVGSMLLAASPESAVPFFGESLLRLPPAPQTVTNRRVATDQLLDALLLSHHLDSSRHFATEAIKHDPDYPLNYYNLARTDAQQRDWESAGAHLRQAFDRKTNTLPGEHLPDPLNDASFLKLQKVEPFWNLVKTLPRNTPPVALKTRDTTDAATSMDLALPNHPGRLSFEAPGFKITEASAKPNGNEFGLRGDNGETATEFLAFLFLYADRSPKTDSSDSERCRDFILRHETLSALHVSMFPNDPASSVTIPIALAEYKLGGRSYVRAFTAQGPLCADIAFYSKREITSATPDVQHMLASLRFDPTGDAGFKDLNYYATTLFEHKDPKDAAPIYAKALTMLPANDPGHKWLRYTTDQAAMSYGMSGNLTQSRAVAQQAIEIDPDYPLNYYNLACADAEEGNAPAARTHLEQAFARKPNTLPGEHLPDPTNDDSILKLKNNRAFWSFVESLPKN